VGADDRNLLGDPALALLALGSREAGAPRQNVDGDGDWVLVLTAV